MPKYAVGEYERRFLLDAVPDGADNRRLINDRYLDRTRLRLRTVEHPDGSVDRKLGHKRRPVADDPRTIFHTSLYLDDAEFETLAALPARTLTKHRLAVPVGAVTGSVNVFGGGLTGLVILEVDLADRDVLDRFVPPDWAGPEVTDDERFTGGWLAGRDLGDLAPALADLGWTIPPR